MFIEQPLPHSDALADAERALHDLLTTGGVVRVRHNEKWVDYAPNNIAELQAYVARLRGDNVTTVRFATSKGL